MAIQVYKCKKCSKMVEMLQNSPCPTVCCGDEMLLLKANTSDGASEKHVPVVNVNGSQVEIRVGSATHPMQNDHWIQFVLLETTAGVQRKELKPSEEPVAKFSLIEGENAVAAYEYCNKHGLWKADI